MEEEKKEERNIELEIVSVIDRVRPFIQSDGGDIRFVKFEDGIVYIKFFGACVGCASIDSTITDGVEAIIRDEIPEVVKVVQVESFDI